MQVECGILSFTGSWRLHIGSAPLCVRKFGMIVKGFHTLDLYIYDLISNVPSLPPKK